MLIKYWKSRLFKKCKTHTHAHAQAHAQTLQKESDRQSRCLNAFLFLVYLSSTISHPSTHYSLIQTDTLYLTIRTQNDQQLSDWYHHFHSLEACILFNLPRSLPRPLPRSLPRSLPHSLPRPLPHLLLQTPFSHLLHRYLLSSLLHPTRQYLRTSPSARR